jgi:predicted cupin superfamily sugar epimerase
MTASEVKKILGLEPHPREGGWFRQTWASGERIVEADRYEGPRMTGTAIYYLLEPDSFSEMHLLQSDEVFHFYAGDPVEQLQLRPDGSGQRVVMGTDLAAGQRPQWVVERGVWQGARMVAGGSWALLGCTVSPGFEYADYTSGEREALLAGWPGFAGLIRALTRAGDAGPAKF